MRGPHEPYFSKEAISHFSAEAKDKLATKHSRLVRYYLIKDNLPEQIKVLTIAAIPKKSKDIWSIIDLSFSL